MKGEHPDETELRGAEGLAQKRPEHRIRYEHAAQQPGDVAARRNQPFHREENPRACGGVFHVKARRRARRVVPIDQMPLGQFYGLRCRWEVQFRTACWDGLAAR